MFQLVAAFTFLLTHDSWAHHPSSSEALTKATLAVPCNDSDLLKKIQNQEPLVPPVLYHYGPQRPLIENAEHGQIPAVAWDKFIMGPQSRYGLPHERRGLYGTAALDTNSFYSPPQTDWMMEIQIQPDCREPERVFSLMDFWNDPRFKKWFSKNRIKGFPTLQAVEENCSHINDSFEGFVRESCRELISRFFKDHNFAILHDHLIRKSFYIRDRSCLHAVLSTPNQLLSVLASRTYLWKPLCGESYELNGILPDLLGRILQNLTTPPSPQILNQIENNSEFLKPESKEKVKRLIDRYRAFRK